MRIIARITPAALLALCVAAESQAQTCTNAGAASASCSVVATATAVVQHVVSLNVGTTALSLSGISNISAYNGSGIATTADNNLQNITVRANRSWTLSVMGNSATWALTSAGGTTDPGKAVGDLAWSTTGGAPYTAVTTSNATVSTGSATNSTTVPMSYQTTYDITKDVPGSYAMGLTFTISAP